MEYKEYFDIKIGLDHELYFIHKVVKYLNREIRVEQIERTPINDIRNRKDALKCISDWNNYIDKINEEIKGEFPSLDFYKIEIENNLTDQSDSIRVVNTSNDGSLLGVTPTLGFCKVEKEK